MLPKPEATNVIPAPPGYLSVYSKQGPNKDEVHVKEDIVAFRIESTKRSNGQELFETCFPITLVVGDSDAILSPSGRVASAEGDHYLDINEYAAAMGCKDVMKK